MTSYRADKVFKVHGRTNGLTFMRKQQQYPFGLKGQGVKRVSVLKSVTTYSKVTKWWIHEHAYLQFMIYACAIRSSFHMLSVYTMYTWGNNKPCFPVIFSLEISCILLIVFVFCVAIHSWVLTFWVMISPSGDPQRYFQMKVSGVGQWADSHTLQKLIGPREM